MSAAYELKADRVSYINNDSKMMKVAYTRRWVAATTKSLPAKQLEPATLWGHAENRLYIVYYANII